MSLLLKAGPRHATRLSGVVYQGYLVNPAVSGLGVLSHKDTIRLLCGSRNTTFFFPCAGMVKYVVVISLIIAQVLGQTTTFARAQDAAQAPAPTVYLLLNSSGVRLPSAGHLQGATCLHLISTLHLVYAGC